LSGCGSSSGEDETIRPIAVADLSSERLSPADTLTLSSVASTTENEAIQSWLWDLSVAPESNAVTIANADAAQASFTPTEPGDYQVCLTVTDNKAQSVPDCADFIVINPNPTAVINPISSTVGQRVQLDGSDSLPPTDGDSDFLTYQWSIDSMPEGSAVALDDAAIAKPRITTDLEGNYELSLTVGYLDKISETTHYTVSASYVNTAPVPVIDIQGGDINAWVLGETATFDGSGSTDADDDDLQYR
ncbi:hypothetical protein N7931_19330, partial [Catenovulum sp. 2E275]|uniref:PKD domain-containing protein n=1 Tax=Catenovulum sp. 2E275 TaxID=2980497 RepID=UPI0021D31DFD